MQCTQLLKTASKKLVYKTSEFLGNKIVVTKSNNNKIVKTDENSRNVEEIIKKREKMLNKIKTSIIKMEHYLPKNT